MTANQGQLRGERPVVVAGVEVGVADAGAVELDETLAGGEVLGLLDGVVVDDGERRVGLLDDGRLLGLGDGELGCHCGLESEGCGGGGGRAESSWFI